MPAINTGGYIPPQTAAQPAVNVTPTAPAPAASAPASTVATTETSSLSPIASRDAIQEKRDNAFRRMTGAFGKLSEDDKKDLGGQIGARLHSLEDGKNLTDAQKFQLKKDTMAGVSAEWAAKKAGGAHIPDAASPDSTPAGQPYSPAPGYQSGQLSAESRNLGDLYYGGTEYLKGQNDFLNAGGQLGQ